MWRSFVENTRVSCLGSNWELSDILIEARTHKAKALRPTARQTNPKRSSFPLPSVQAATDYETVYVWHVNPENIFDRTPYRQFCRWRNGNQAQRTRIAKMESWNVTRSKRIEPNTDDKTSTLLQIQFDCHGTMRKSPLGAGNWVQILYLLRLAMGIPIDMEMICNDDENTLKQIQSTLIMPWLMGRFSSERTRHFLSKYWGGTNNNNNTFPTECLTTQWGEAPVGWMIPLIRYDLRRMVVALVGVPKEDPTHPAHAWARKQQQQQTRNDPPQAAPDKKKRPWHPLDVYYDTPTSNSSSFLSPLFGNYDWVPLLSSENIELDDVVIHFRCGDIMASKHYYFRFLKFHEFASKIDPATTYIGIVTQSFGVDDTSNRGGSYDSKTKRRDEQARTKDHDDEFRVNACQRIVSGWERYIFRSAFRKLGSGFTTDPTRPLHWPMHA